MNIAFNTIIVQGLYSCMTKHARSLYCNGFKCCESHI